MSVSLTASENVTFTDVTKDEQDRFLARLVARQEVHRRIDEWGSRIASTSTGTACSTCYLVNSPTVETALRPGEAAERARSELWRNRGDGTFVDVTDKAGVGYPGWGMGVVAADFDNDGWDDLYVTCYGPNRLYRNKGDGTFADVTEKAAVGDARWSTGAAFGDYDGDGWLDLFVANYVDVRLDALPAFGKGKFCEFRGVPVQCGPRGLNGSGDSLYRNKGDGTFEDVSNKAGVADPSGRFGMGVAWSDFDGDGRPDLFVANDAGPNFLYKNNGNGTFVDVALQAGGCAQRGRKRAGLDGCRRRGLRSFRRLEPPRHEFLRRVQRPLSARQGLSVHRRLVRVADSESQHPTRRLGHAFRRL